MMRKMMLPGNLRVLELGRAGVDQEMISWPREINLVIRKDVCLSREIHAGYQSLSIHRSPQALSGDRLF